MTEPVTEFIWYCGTLSAALAGLNVTSIVQAMHILDTACLGGHTIFIAGNGGSAAIASHFTADLNKKASVGRTDRFRALSLADNVPGLTAWANDAGYPCVFSEQLKNFGREGDVLVVLSTSGRSPNIVVAINEAHALKMKVIALTGDIESEASLSADLVVHVDAPRQTMQEDLMSVVCHALAENL